MYITRWELHSGREISRWELDAPVDCIRYSFDGTELIFNQRHPAGHQICFRKLSSGTHASTDRFLFPPDKLKPTETFLPLRDGTRLLLAVGETRGSNEYKVCLADATSGEIQSTCFSLGPVGVQPPGRCLEFAISPDETWVAAISDNEQVRWGKIASQTNTLTFRQHLIHSAQFSSDGKILGIGTADMVKDTAKFVFLDVETGRQTDEWNLTPVETWSLAPTRDWQSVYQGGAHFKVHVNRRSSPEKIVLPGHSPAETWGLAFSPDGNRLITSGDDWKLRVWNLESFQQEKDLAGHDSLVTKVACSADGKTFASVDFEGKMILWNSRSAEPVREFQAHQGTLRAVAISPDNSHLAFGGQFGQLWVCDPLGNSPDEHYEGFTEAQFESMAFSPDSRRLFATFNKDEFCCLTLATGKIDLLSLPKQSRVCAVSAKRNMLAIGLQNGAIQYYELDPLHEVHSHQAHSLVDPKRTDILALAFSPDGRTLASGGMDGTVRLWHVETKQELLRFEDIPCQVNHLAFAPDGLTLAAALHNGEIWLWRAK